MLSAAVAVPSPHKLLPTPTRSLSCVSQAKCATCHTCNEGGPNKQGPNLFGVLGRQSGQVSGFKYTEANKNSGIMWSNQTLL